MVKGREISGRLSGRLARAPGAVAGRPVARPLPGSAELPGPARRTLSRRRRRAGALPRLHLTMLRHGSFSRMRRVTVVKLPEVVVNSASTHVPRATSA
eukprot:scaffold106241_cov65-Phaeocystis_antarctica.AAC.1